ncbi:MAG: DUF86 domain-containing protein [Clostridiaceae bacterium]|nr:DUF86 domain-containing protein [Clostridiaceae bacterium]
MSINEILVRQRLVLTGQAVDHLWRLSTVPIERFVNSDLSAAAESHLHRTLEAIFDVGRLLLSINGTNEPAQKDASIVRGLAEKGIISPGLRATLTEMAGYRDRLVQLDNLVPDEEIHTIMNHQLTDHHDFITQIEKYLKSAVT